jgi:23S rRNA pseudouridine1911/1915/1917 synthase
LQEDIEIADGDQELFEHFNIKVDKGQTLLRIDKFLFDRTGQSRNRIQNAAEAGSILVNGKVVKSSYRVKPMDEISLVLPYPKRELEITPENIPLNIVFEDEYLIVVNKPAGMVVHPAYGNYSGTLINALLYHFKDLKELSGDPVRPGLVHRIDKNTSGLLLIAKNEFALTHLAKQFFEKTTQRKYIALVWGEPEKEAGTITGHVGRSQKDRKVMDVYPDGSYGKPAITHYKIIEPLGYVTLIECQLETGRTHQIRVHFKHIGHPLFNDAEYGGDRIMKGTTFSKYKQFIDNCFELLPRQALHAKSLGFIHPVTKQHLHFESELPDDIKNVIEKWRKYVAAR